MNKRLVAGLALGLVVGTVVTGCGTKAVPKPSSTVATPVEAKGVAKLSGFEYSQVFDENGFIKGIKAKDLVKDLFDTAKLVIPKETVAIKDEAVKAQIQQICNYYGLTTKITDRAIKKDDKVNMDYVGSVEGKEFDGGNTKKAGTVVTAGSSEYVDTFLTQIIGHKAGDTFDVNVTFPAGYSTKDLAGKKAKFVTTINYIKGEGTLTDEAVKKNLSLSNGWNTVADAEKGIKENLRKGQIQDYITNYIIKFAESNVDKTKLSKEYLDYYNKVTVAYFQDSANKANMSFTDYISTYAQVKDEKALLEKLKLNNDRETVNAVVVQALAEKEKLTVTDADIKKYAETAIKGVSDGDVAQYEKQYGKPYIKHIIIQQKVTNFISERAIIEQ